MSLKQRVPIVIDAQGKGLFITIEWLKDLQALVGGGTDGGFVTQAQFDTLQGQVNGFQATINALVQANDELAERVRALESGYQS